jgi:AcrR family transcriptional regulator
LPVSAAVVDARIAVVEAASRCFRRYGPRKTSMGDIADEARISRPALYRLFADRQALLDAVLRRRVEELIERVVPRAEACSTFAESILEACISAIEYIRETPDLYRLFAETDIGQAGLDLLRYESEPLAQASQVWRLLLKRGRATGEIRDGLVEEDFIEWVSTLILVYAERDDIPLSRLRALFNANLVPIVARQP